MKTKNRICFCLLIVIGLTLILANSCKKADDYVIKDADSNDYTSVTIGTQVWMVENLKTTKYNNGDLIGTTTPVTLDISGEAAPKYQWAYDGNESNVDTYGRLYTFYAITDIRGVCPNGWHVPSDAEWTTLTTFLGGESVAGGKLKETGTDHWRTPNSDATNETGFTALPGGLRYASGPYVFNDSFGLWWSSTEYSEAYAYYRIVNYDGGDVTRDSSIYGHEKQAGFSVRCLKNN